VLEWLSRTEVVHNSTPKVVNQSAFGDDDHRSHALTYDLDDPSLDSRVGLSTLAPLYSTIVEALTSYNYDLRRPIRTFVIVSLDHVIQDPSRTTAQETAVMKYYNETLVITIAVIRIVVSNPLRQHPINQLLHSRHPDGNIIAATCTLCEHV